MITPRRFSCCRKSLNRHELHYTALFSTRRQNCSKLIRRNAASGDGMEERWDAGASNRSEGSDDTRRAGETSSSSSNSNFPDSLPLLGADTDWREFRARLVAQERGNEEIGLWAHGIPKPEKGSLLLAHPMMFNNSQQYFFQSVILLLDHDETGSYGIILNRPSQYTLAELALTKELAEFDKCRLFVGGDVGDGSLQLVHAISGLTGSVEIVRGVYVGGIEAARQKVASGDVDASQFRWFARYAGWGPGQLQSECASGVWFIAAASPELIVQTPKDANGRDYWHRVLQLMGGDHKLLSERIKAAEAQGDIKSKASEGQEPDSSRP